MCGLFGSTSFADYSLADIRLLIEYAERRGKDSSGIVLQRSEPASIEVHKADKSLTSLFEEVNAKNIMSIFCHSRLITNDGSYNQPVFNDDIIIFHNGIIVNHESIREDFNYKNFSNLDSEVLLPILEDVLETSNGDMTLFQILLNKVLDEKLDGTVSIAVLLKKQSKLILYSNNGSLYYSEGDNGIIYHSERHPLEKIGAANVNQIYDVKLFDVDLIGFQNIVNDTKTRTIDYVPEILSLLPEESSCLIYKKHDLLRCVKCILPESFPHIYFDAQGVCNYCNNYIPKNINKNPSDFHEIIDSYTHNDKSAVIVPFSGGRDSTYALDIIVNELKLKPLTMTYDWGMVTDLARRNVSRTTSRLGVENIIIADDISLKRKNIRMNLLAWLKKPHLGMLNILMAGDKHFFKHIETIKKENNIVLNLWGMNHLETTHFKAGFLGVKPNFDQKQVFSTGVFPQLDYQSRRLKQMIVNPSYINSSLWDTFSGEYYRSVKKKSGFFNIFDYYDWDEEVVNNRNGYLDFELSLDSSSSWRIGDGTAGFYNYVYYKVAGFTEFDTFRSNQIREGMITREEALNFIFEENKPRYLNIKLYLDVLGIDFKKTLQIINNIESAYD